MDSFYLADGLYVSLVSRLLIVCRVAHGISANVQGFLLC